MDCFEDLLLVEFTEELKLNVLRFFASDVIRSCFLLAPDVVAREYSSCTEKVNRFMEDGVLVGLLTHDFGLPNSSLSTCPHTAVDNVSIDGLGERGNTKLDLLLPGVWNYKDRDE